MKYIARIYDASKKVVYSDEGKNSLDAIHNLHRFIEDHNLKSGRYYILEKHDDGEVNITSKDISELKDPSRESKIEKFYFDLRHKEPDICTLPLNTGMERSLESIVLNKEQIEMLRELL